MDCYCLCVINHPDERGICTGEAEKILGITHPINGKHLIDMCDHCASQTLATQADRELREGIQQWKNDGSE